METIDLNFIIDFIAGFTLFGILSLFFKNYIHIILFYIVIIFILYFISYEYYRIILTLSVFPLCCFFILYFMSNERNRPYKERSYKKYSRHECIQFAYDDLRRWVKQKLYLHFGSEYGTTSQCLHEYNSFKNQLHDFEEIYPLIDDSVSRDIELTESIELTLKEKNCTYLDIICIFVNNACSDLILSGQYCIYRGRLDTRGSMLYRLYDITLDKLLKDGYYTEEEIKEQKSKMRDELSSVG